LAEVKVKCRQGPARAKQCDENMKCVSAKWTLYLGLASRTLVALLALVYFFLSFIYLFFNFSHVDY